MVLIDFLMIQKMIQIEDLIDVCNEILLSESNTLKYPILKGSILTLLKRTIDKRQFTNMKSLNYQLVLTKGHRSITLYEYTIDILGAEYKGEESEALHDVIVLKNILQLFEDNNGIVHTITTKLESNDRN